MVVGVSVPADVAAQTLRIATELPVSGGIRSGVWLNFFGDWWLEFHGREQWVTDVRRARDWAATVRVFTSWDEVRVALGEVEERGSWWAE